MNFFRLVPAAYCSSTSRWLAYICHFPSLDFAKKGGAGVVLKPNTIKPSYH